MDQSLINELALIIQEFVNKNGSTDDFINYFTNYLLDRQNIRKLADKKINIFIEEERVGKPQTKAIVDHKTKDIHFYRKKLQSFYEDLANGVEGLFDEEEKRKLKYLALAKVIIHEVEHIKQYIKIKENNRDDLESLILMISNSENREDLLSLIGYNYAKVLNPEERYADYVGFSSVVNICNALGEEYHRPALLFEAYNVHGYLSGYFAEYDDSMKEVEDKGPTYCYFVMYAYQNDLEELDKLLQKKELSFDERLYLGLELSDDEIESIMSHGSNVADELKGGVKKK